MIGRRKFITLAAASALPVRVAGQVRPRAFRVAVVRPTRRPDAPDDFTIAGYVRAFAELGFVEGTNFLLEHHYADGDASRLPGLIRALVATPIDVIIATGVTVTRVAREEAPGVPIVMFANLDPVALGLVTRLSRPSGNVTGILIAADGTLAGKRLELLREAASGAQRFVLLAPDDPQSFAIQASETRKAANALGVSLAIVTVNGQNYAEAFAAVTASGAEAILVGAHTKFVHDRQTVIDFAAKHRLPALYEWAEQVRQGGLMSYGSILEQRQRQVAAYVVKILQGAKPADLPIEQPTHYQLAVNLRTAKALGLTVPPSIMLQATEVIE